MKTTIEILHPDRFEDIEVDTEGLSCTETMYGTHNNFQAEGYIRIFKGKTEIHASTGFFGQKDYLNEYGFILVPDKTL